MSVHGSEFESRGAAAVHFLFDADLWSSFLSSHSDDFWRPLFLTGLVNIHHEHIVDRQ